MKQTRARYAWANTIIRKFSSASLSTKLLLFRAYCTPLYGCQLWCSCSSTHYRKLNVAYNDAFRQLLQELDGVVRHSVLYLIIYQHSLLIFVSLCTRCVAHFVGLRMFSYKLQWTLFHRYFADGVNCCLTCFYVFSIFLFYFFQFNSILNKIKEQKYFM